MTRQRWLWTGLTGLVVVVVFVLVWFQPQKLFIDERVDDTLPAVTAPATPSSSVPTPTEVARGQFVSRDHGTSGTVRIVDLGGTRIVRLEGLDTDNGPDLYLYLSPNPANGSEQAFDDGHLNLGRLKGNLGDQNYDLPDGTDLTRFRSVVIWCDRFNSAFGAADLLG